MPDPTRLILEKPLTVRWVAELKPVLHAALDQGGDRLVLGLAAVPQIDGAGYQLLRAFQRALAARGKALLLEDADPKVAARIRLAGGSDLFEAGAPAKVISN
ncbi:MAG: STAS domain-containing protein [Spirochaetes bacterium]|nr:STAS domain-containing protein [Spirochaetota bacterium]